MTKICQHAGCENQANIKGGARGYCNKHYLRVKKFGDSNFTAIERGVEVCSVEGCGRKNAGKRLCMMHRARLRTRGTLHIERPETKLEWIERHKHYGGDDCLPWPFGVALHGRGIVQIGSVNTSAPRAMCLSAHGDPPSPAHEAAHSCGNGHVGCLNPKHLSWKTRKENEADKVIHGTLRKGSDINTSKLSERQVGDIRRMSREGVPGKVLAQRYGVTRSAISAIVTRKTWAWLE